MNTYGTLQYITRIDDSSAYQDVVDDTEEQNSYYASAIDCTTPLRNSIIRRKRLLESRRRDRAAIYNWKTFLLAFIFLSGFFIGSYLLLHDCNDLASNFPFYLIELSEWYQHQDKLKSLKEKNLKLPISTILVSHTGTRQCYDVDRCIRIISKLINENLENSPFNFLISSDAKIYEMRGWRFKSGKSFDSENIFVGFIGNFTDNELVFNQHLALEALIVEGRRRKYLTSDYKIYGLRKNSKDGKNIFNKICEMKHFEGYAES